jgi:hypothetical protein
VFRHIGLAVVAMAGETGSDAIRKILGRHGVSAGYQQNNSEQPAHPYASHPDRGEEREGGAGRPAWQFNARRRGRFRS